MKTAVFINFSSNSGNALKKWRLIEPDVRKILSKDTLYIPYETPFDFRQILGKLVKSGIKQFVSAGGDGSINLLLNALAEVSPNMEQFCLGAIGLGSSNDFLKPVYQQIAGVPVKLNFVNKQKTDLGKVIISNPQQEIIERYFAVNASLGFTAEGNLAFNKGDKIIRYLKPRSANFAILWTVLKTLYLFHNLTVNLQCNGTSGNIRLTNVSIAKNPNVSGNFKYNVSTAPNSGKLGLYIAENLSKPEILKLLYNLSQARFSSQNKCHVSFIEQAGIYSKSPIAVETDGEIYAGCSFRFSVVPGTIFVAN